MNELLIKAILTQELYDVRICESANQQSTVDYLYEALLLDRLLYGEPVTVPELRKLLRKKILNFEFIKLDGEIRPAKGTTMMKYIPQSDHPKGIRPSSPKVATFFDMKKKEWRSVSQRSKEIVLDKDEETGKPVVKVTDKGAEGEPVKMEKPEVEPEIVKPEVTAPEVTPEKDFQPGDVYGFTVKKRKTKYLSGDTKSFDVDTFITITRTDDQGTWGKTAGSEIDILLTPERMERLGNKIEVGDKFEFAKLDKNRKKIFTSIEITRKDDDGYWGKTEGSDKDILLTNERLKRLHKLEHEEELPPSEEVPEVPEEPIITIDGKAPEEVFGEEPEVPEEPEEEPYVTIDGEPAEPLEAPLVNVEPILKPEPVSLEMPIPPEKEKGIPKIKPIEKAKVEKSYHFRNSATGAGLDLEISPKDTIKKLKQLGPNWYLITDKEYQNEKEGAEGAEEKDEIKIPAKPIVKKPLKMPIIPKKGKDLGNLEAGNL